MARIRTIKPEFFTSLTIADLPAVETRLTFIGLWTHVDDEGRCVDDARLVKAAIWPLDDRTSHDVELDLKALSEASLITRYKVGERSFIQVTNWREHQKINRPTRSKFPPVEEATETSGISSHARKSKPATSGDESSSSSQDALTDDSVRTHGDLTGGKEQGTGNREQGKEPCAPQAEHEPELFPAPPSQPKRTHRRPYGDDDFDAFWEVYPRKDDPKKAWSCWQAAVKIAPAEVITAGAKRYRDDPNRSEQYTKLATTWLNAGSWANGALPARNGSAAPGPSKPDWRDVTNQNHSSWDQEGTTR
jgi:hypothetical protein